MYEVAGVFARQAAGSPYLTGTCSGRGVLDPLGIRDINVGLSFVSAPRLTMNQVEVSMMIPAGFSTEL